MESCSTKVLAVVGAKKRVLSLAQRNLTALLSAVEREFEIDDKQNVSIRSFSLFRSVINLLLSAFLSCFTLAKVSQFVHSRPNSLRDTGLETQLWVIVIGGSREVTRSCVSVPGSQTV